MEDSLSTPWTSRIVSLFVWGEWVGGWVGGRTVQCGWDEIEWLIGWVGERTVPSQKGYVKREVKRRHKFLCVEKSGMIGGGQPVLVMGSFSDDCELVHHISFHGSLETKPHGGVGSGWEELVFSRNS